jgi:hypothetical protein
MPKITRYGGASNAAAGLSIVGATWTDGEDADEWATGPAVLPAGDTVTPEEESSPGTSSTTSSEKLSSDSEPSKSSPRKRARTTASRSEPAPTADSSAPSTDGDPTAADDGGPA